MFEPLGQQLIACDKIREWAKNPRKKTFVLGGYAGTGKTSLIEWIREEILWPLDYRNIVVCTYTNKAAAVLRSKGIQDATTIHRVMYQLISEEEMTWARRGQLDAGLIIVDEASMVGWRVREDLESYGIPIIYVGDPFQLPPVGDDESSIMDKPDYTLTEIRRQAEGSPIIKIATAIREGKRYEDIDQCTLRDKDLLDYEAIICLSNARRHKLNQRKRNALGLEGPAKPGDRVMIATTDYDHGLYAGECGTLLETNYKRRYIVQFDGWTEVCRLFNAHFLAPGDNPYDYRGRQCLDFGYVTTCHKAQGSQYDSVLVWEERRADARWKYTAATRAVNKLLMAG